MKSKDPNINIKVKKHLLFNHVNQTNRHMRYFHQSIPWSNRENFQLRKDSNKRQSSKILAIWINTTPIQKNKKIENDVSQVKCYNCHKKSHYTNKYSNRQSKN